VVRIEMVEKKLKECIHLGSHENHGGGKGDDIYIGYDKSALY
jgi:hypothetical protein